MSNKTGITGRKLTLLKFKPAMDSFVRNGEAFNTKEISAQVGKKPVCSIV